MVKKERILDRGRLKALIAVNRRWEGSVVTQTKAAYNCK